MLIVSVPDDGYSTMLIVSIPDEGYSRQIIVHTKLDIYLFN